jgi:hypothetical protein
MTTQAEAQGFRKLLNASREAVKRVLATELPDVTHPNLHWHLDPDEAKTLASVDSEVLLKRAELFRLGKKNVLTDMEIAVALLRPHAGLVRQTLRQQSCGCHRCG